MLDLTSEVRDAIRAVEEDRMDDARNLLHTLAEHTEAFQTLFHAMQQALEDIHTETNLYIALNRDFAYYATRFDRVSQYTAPFLSSEHWQRLRNHAQKPVPQPKVPQNPDYVHYGGLFRKIQAKE